MVELGSIEFEFLEYIEEEWDSYMEAGCSIEDATTQILAQYEDMLEQDERVILYIVLGDIQVDLDYVDERVRNELMEIITSKGALDSFEGNKQLKKTLNYIKKRL
ncbi:hypothetical protein CS063_03610 [Sporanaerobium hydrogeniformans]|uniref:Uncharacterized protein n=1 Tax=Sporanaerobium hydrogeniformans TaxID=3072179 RepID=A0AC61DFK6_9FIRM|nr:hypothetical protein [Sporanaerobium hydrogeniformans]PHV71660.1 hypothetical protein CS063_03610 [Sporanaerobium hydrogeniformans]